ncbi:MAG TPA: type I glutamate--ammonia ligase [Candidatus Izemoplasmatales bacterium]|nr:type I glutamate--ammonia ligase [Candidatus Izemoplasmatales bacterium]
MFKNIEELMAYVNEEKIKIIDLKVVDMKGQWHRISITSQKLDGSIMEKGIGFDGSSYGFLTVEKSDMVMIPDLKTAYLDPFKTDKTLTLIANIYIIKNNRFIRYEDDPRYIAEKTEEIFRSNNISDEILLGPEFEFYVLDHISYQTTNSHMEVKIDSQQADWNTKRCEGNLGLQIRKHGAYHLDSPFDSSYELRTKVVLEAEKINIPIKYHHSENGGPGQVEIEVNFAGIKEMGDRTMKLKHLLNNTAINMKKTITFMPKPFADELGNGMHVHIQLKNKGKYVFFDKNGYSNLSKIAHYVIGGILKHAKSLCAFTNPSTNSYKRLVPGFEAPVTVAYATANRSAVIRIPGYAVSQDEKRFELRSPDAMANPYLAYSAIMLAAYDGIKNEIDPSKQGYGPYDINLYDLPDKEKAKIQSLPTNLSEAVQALKDDHDYLLVNDIFSQTMINNHMKKLLEESRLISILPHPKEFELYYHR